MKARYIGDPRSPEGPIRVRFGGLSFARNVFVDIDGLPPVLQTKLAANGRFEVSMAPVNDEDEAAQLAADRQFAPDEERDPFDQDGDGKPGGPVMSEDKDALLDELDRLAGQHPDAVKFDRRWGVPKLRAALEAARFEIGEDE